MLDFQKFNFGSQVINLGEVRILIGLMHVLHLFITNFTKEIPSRNITVSNSNYLKSKKAMTGEWVPFGDNAIVFLLEKLGCQDRIQAGWRLECLL